MTIAYFLTNFDEDSKSISILYEDGQTFTTRIPRKLKSMFTEDIPILEETTILDYILPETGPINVVKSALGFSPDPSYITKVTKMVPTERSMATEYIVGDELDYFIQNIHYPLDDTLDQADRENLIQGRNELIKNLTSLREPNTPIPDEIKNKVAEYEKEKFVPDLKEWTKNNYGVLNVYDTPGTYEFVVPELWFRVIAVIIGGGATSFEGGPGEIVKCIIPASAGETITITVGAAGELSQIQTSFETVISHAHWIDDNHKQYYRKQPYGDINSSGLVAFYG